MRLALPSCLLLALTLLAGCGGGSNNSGGGSTSPLATTIALSASPNPNPGSFTLTAIVSASGATPTGSVTFLDGTTNLGTANLGGGAATLTVNLPAGTDSLTASYAGATGFDPSTSTPVSVVVQPASVATSTALTASPNPATAGATVTLTATVTATGASPTGSVSFLDGSATIGTATLTNGVATLPINNLAPGTTHTLTASYAGAAGLLGSTSAPVAEVINAASLNTTTALTATPNPAAAGATVTLTATVSSSAGTPTGSVTFLDGTSTLGSVALTNGVASYSTSTLAAGTTQSLTASYAGTTGFLASTSPALSEVINPAAVSTTTTLTASPNPAAAGATVTLNATVTSPSGTPTGNVTFLDGTSTLATIALTNGSATYSTSTLPAGSTQSVTASYAGTSAFNASTSNAVSEVIAPALSATATFSFTTPNQTILGFGGAEAFYATYLDNHPYESQIMSALFDPVQGLGITFLRLQNNYYTYSTSNPNFDPDNIKIFNEATSALGAAPSVLLSSWTPPANLKSNNSIDGCTTVTNGNCTGGFGTLAQNSTNTGYNYTGFGQFWLSSLQAYAAQGLTPTYISIQNEPDYAPSYVGCLFNPTEAPVTTYGTTSSYASYGKAFNAVYSAINAGGLTTVPKMIGPEAFNVADAPSLLTDISPTSEITAVAHHLYGVSSEDGNPAGNIAPEQALETAFPTQLKFETEYYQVPAFDNAVQIHQALTVANDNVFLYWGLTWPSTLVNGASNDQQGLLYIDNPFNAQSTWAFPNGWTYNDAYYVMKGYSYFIRPGYIRYDASVTNADEDVSVYQSPDTKTTVIVLLNTSSTATDTVGLNLSGITYTNSAVYRSSFATPITTTGAERWNSLGAYTSSGITMPPQSEVTVVLTQ